VFGLCAFPHQSNPTLGKKQFKKSIIVSASNILQKMMVGHQA